MNHHHCPQLIPGDHEEQVPLPQLRILPPSPQLRSLPPLQMLPPPQLRVLEVLEGRAVLEASLAPRAGAHRAIGPRTEGWGAAAHDPPPQLRAPLVLEVHSASTTTPAHAKGRDPCHTCWRDDLRGTASRHTGAL